MSNGKGQGSPAASRPNHHRNQAALHRELLELERRKLVALSSGRVTLTLEGYQAIARAARRRS